MVLIHRTILRLSLFEGLNDQVSHRIKVSYTIVDIMMFIPSI